MRSPEGSIGQAEEPFGADGQHEAQVFLSYADAMRRPSSGAEANVTFSRSRRCCSAFRRCRLRSSRRESRDRSAGIAVKPFVLTPQLTEQLVNDAQGAAALPLLALRLEWLYRQFTNGQGTRIGSRQISESERCLRSHRQSASRASPRSSDSSPRVAGDSGSTSGARSFSSSTRSRRGPGNRGLFPAPSKILAIHRSVRLVPRTNRAPARGMRVDRLISRNTQ